MRSRVLLFIFFLTGFFLVQPLSVHAMIPFLGPIIPPQSVTGVAGSEVCAAGWGMIIIVINNIIEFLITIAIVFVAPIMIAYAGFLYVWNPVSPSGISKAKDMLTNVVVGIVVALAGWMIVDAVMAVLYNSVTPVSDGSTLKTWSDIINWNGDKCLIQAGAMKDLKQAVTTGVTAGAGAVTGGVNVQCPSSNTACSPAVLRAAGFTPNQANAMSCIAMTESTGNPYTKPSSTGACGLFQITNQPGNWSNSAFHKSPCSTTSSCNDPVCNTQTAQIMFSKQGYQPWTGKNPNGTYWNANAVACAQKYDPGARI